jgi:hypothetical protein
MRDDQRAHPRSPASDRARRRHPYHGQPVRLTRLVHLVLSRPARRIQGKHPAQGRAPAAGQGNSARCAQRSVDRRQQGAKRDPRRPGRRRSRHAQPPGRLRLRRASPGAARHLLVRHRHGPGFSKSARPPSQTPSWSACSSSTTGSTAGRPRSARCSVKRGNLAG